MPFLGAWQYSPGPEECAALAVCRENLDAFHFVLALLFLVSIMPIFLAAPGFDFG